jgi:uncharacterized membrane protein YkvA (DUF1232 family)
VTEFLRALPLIGRAVVRLAADPSLPRATKIALGAVAVYLASPFDLLPDVIPFLGYLDDVLVLAVLVDGVLNYVDRSLVLRYWPGSSTSLEKVARVAHVLAIWIPARVRERIFSGRRQ